MLYSAGSLEISETASPYTSEKWGEFSPNNREGKQKNCWRRLHISALIFRFIEWNYNISLHCTSHTCLCLHQHFIRAIQINWSLVVLNKACYEFSRSHSSGFRPVLTVTLHTVDCSRRNWRSLTSLVVGDVCVAVMRVGVVDTSCSTSQIQIHEYFLHLALGETGGDCFMFQFA